MPALRLSSRDTCATSVCHDCHAADAFGNMAFERMAFLNQYSGSSWLDMIQRVVSNIAHLNFAVIDTSHTTLEINPVVPTEMTGLPRADDHPAVTRIELLRNERRNDAGVMDTPEPNQGSNRQQRCFE